MARTDVEPLQFEKYRYLRLTDTDQLRHHKLSVAFNRFLTFARDPSAYKVRVS